MLHYASIQSVSSKLKTTSTLNSSLSSHQRNVSPKTFKTPITSYEEKYAPISAAKSPYSSDQGNVCSPSVTTLSISLHKTSGMAASVICSILPSNTIHSSVNFVSSVNSVNSYVARTNPLSFKTTISLVLKYLASFKTSVCIKSSVSGTVSNGAVSDSINSSQSCVALVQHSISNYKQVADLNSFISGDIYLSSLGKFSSSVTIKCFFNISVLTGIIFVDMLFVQSIINLSFSVFSIFD